MEATGQSAENINESGQNLRSAWNAVKRNNLIVCSDVFGFIAPDDVIEIYDLKGFQIFRSFDAYQYSSYTIEELNSYPFYELFERDLNIEALYATEFVRMLSGEVTSTCRLDIPSHTMRERLSARKNVSFVTPKYVSPLKNKQGRIVAFIHTSSIRRHD